MVVKLKIDDLKNVITSTIKEILTKHKTELEVIRWGKKELFVTIEAQKSEIENQKVKLEKISVENEDLKKTAGFAFVIFNFLDISYIV